MQGGEIDTGGRLARYGLTGLPVLIYMGLHLLARRFPAELWGVDVLLYYPPGVAVLLLAAPGVAAGLAAVWGRAPRLRAGARRWARAADARGSVLIGSSLLVVPLLFALRDKTHLLGDSKKWFAVLETARLQTRSFDEIGWHNARIDLPGLEFLNYQQALDLLLHYGVYRLGHRWAAWSPADAYAAVSYLSGAALLATLWRLSRLLSSSLAARATVVGLLLSLGTLQFFCGYGESYTLVTLITAVYLGTALRCLAGAQGLRGPVCLWLLGVATHMLALSLLPSLLYLLWRDPVWGPRLRQPRWLVPLGLTGAAGAILGYGRFYADLHLPLIGAGDGRYGLLSVSHLLNLTNAILLVGPFALVWGLAGLLRRVPMTPPLALLGWAGLGSSLLIGVHDIILAGRDWDLMAFPALACSLWGLVYLQAQVGEEGLRAVRRLVLPVMSVHTALWVGVNHDPDRATQRLGNLLRGRPNQPAHYQQFTLAHYHLTIADAPDSALVHLRQAIAAAPPQQYQGEPGPRFRYLDYLGQTYATLGRIAAAQEVYERAYPPGRMPILAELNFGFQVRWIGGYLRRGELLWRAGEKENARAAWEKAIRYRFEISKGMSIPLMSTIITTVITETSARQACMAQLAAFEP